MGFNASLCCMMPGKSTYNLGSVNSLPDDKFLDSSELKKFAEDNFKFDENGRKVSKWVENTVGKAEIARYEKFLLFPQCFQRLVSQGCQKVSTCGNGLNPSCLNLPNPELE